MVDEEFADALPQIAGTYVTIDRAQRERVVS